MPKFKKILVIGISSLFTLGLILSAWSFIKKESVSVYSAGDKPFFLETSFNRTDNKTLASWEKDILEKQNSAYLARGSVTESLAKETLEEYFKIKSNNLTLNEEEFVQSLIAGITAENKDVEYKEYLISNLKISTKNNTDGLKSYGNEVGKLVKESFDPSLPNESVVLLQALRLERESELRKLDPVIENYNLLIKKLLEVEVPSEAVGFHLEMINTFSELSATIPLFKIYLEDPFSGFFALTNYMKVGQKMQNNLKDLDSFFKVKGVVFGESEDGFLIETAANFSLETQ